MNKKLTGFTLVELIIVITILAILASISFVGYNGYVEYAKNSKNLSNLKNIDKGLSLLFINTSKYPIPKLYNEISYSGETLLKQGNFTSELYNLIGINSNNLNQENEIKYSVTNNQKSYQISTANSDGNNKISILSGNYRALFENNFKIFNLPSLIINTIGTIDLNTKFLFNESSSEGDIYSIYLPKVTNNLTNTGILSPYIDDTQILIDKGYSDYLIKEIIGTLLNISCKGDLKTHNSTVYNKFGLKTITYYQNTNSNSNCYFECLSGFSGNNCEIENFNFSIDLGNGVYSTQNGKYVSIPDSGFMTYQTNLLEDYDWDYGITDSTHNRYDNRTFCNNLVLAGYNDWYASNSTQLHVLYNKRPEIPSFTNSSYWTSNQYNSTLGLFLNGGNNTIYNTGKSSILKTRCVRNL